MTRNVGSWERVLRVVIGVILLALVVIGPKTWWGLVGVIPWPLAYGDGDPSGWRWGSQRTKGSDLMLTKVL